MNYQVSVPVLPIGRSLYYTTQEWMKEKLNERRLAQVASTDTAEV